jgi:hypothetical protein
MREVVGVPADVPLAGIIARLTEQKAHRDLFEAMAFTPGLAGLHLIVVGDGNLRYELRVKVESLGLSPRVRFLGARRDMGDLLNAIDIFVMPSLWEGLPLSMVLAMGARLPVVATRVAGIPEVVEHDVTGLLVPPADPAALGAALARLVSDPELGWQLGQAASAFVRPLRRGRLHHSRHRSYDRLLAKKGSREAGIVYHMPFWRAPMAPCVRSRDRSRATWTRSPLLRRGLAVRSRVVRAARRGRRSAQPAPSRCVFRWPAFLPGC